MLPFAGLDLSYLFPPPMDQACAGLDVKSNMYLSINDTDIAALLSVGLHKPGQFGSPALSNQYWYTNNFLPRIKGYYKGNLVYTRSDISVGAQDNNKPWGIYHDSIYDLTDYIYTSKDFVASAGAPNWKFLDARVVDVFTENPGTDISDALDQVYDKELNATERDAIKRCLQNVFYIGRVDTRKTARCQANGIILVVFAGLITAVILVKFLAALQLGSKRKPTMQDKFVICQIPAYTEGEDQLRKALDSLTALQYDNKRKLLCVICDGMVVGGGNDRPTPSIVLDILGVDPKIDPPALPFKSVGEGSAQLNYGKVYSGLYEYEGATRFIFQICLSLLTCYRLCRSIYRYS